MIVEKKYYNEGWFGKHPEIYDKTDVFMKYLRCAAAKKLGLKPQQKIIDIATGTGAQGFEFAKLGHFVVGLDLDIKMLHQAQQKSNNNISLSFIHADAEYIPTRSKFYDLAVISFAMHDVPYEIGLRILREAKRVIKDDGIIYIIEHGDPHQFLAARILHQVSLLFETPNYKPFFLKSLGDYFKETKLEILKKDYLVLGAVRLLTLKQFSRE
jgi:ubiquinone/menaquinone biosynthesis C-methylase UbiE